MKTGQEISCKIDEFRQAIDTLREKRKAELSKSLDKRNHRLLVFLDKELKLYEFGMQQLLWAAD